MNLGHGGWQISSRVHSNLPAKFALLDIRPSRHPVNFTYSSPTLWLSITEDCRLHNSTIQNVLALHAFNLCVVASLDYTVILGMPILPELKLMEFLN